MAYFDGIKVGDTIYHWDHPEVVEKVYGESIEYQIRTNTGALIDFCGGLGWYWLPVPKPVAPPRPKRKVTKEAFVGKRDTPRNGFYIMEFVLPCDATNIKCTYEVEE